MEYLLLAFYIILFSAIILRLPFFGKFGISRRSILLFFFLKLIFGTALWAVYTFYYPERSLADTFKYFDDSKVIFDALRSSPSDYFRMVFMLDFEQEHFSPYYEKMHYWHGGNYTPFFNDAHSIIRINAFLRLFSFGNYHVHTVWMCFLSLIGILYVIKAMRRYAPGETARLYILAFLWPGVLLWSSGVLKESPLFLGIGGFIYAGFRIIKNDFLPKHLLLFLLSCMLILLVKFYILLAFLPGMAAFAWTSRTGKSRTALKFFFVHLLSGALFFLSYFLPPDPEYNPLESLIYKQDNFISLSKGGVYLSNHDKWIYVPYEQKDILLPGPDQRLFKIKTGGSYYLWENDTLQDSLYIPFSTDTSSWTMQHYYIPARSKIEIPRLGRDPAQLIKNIPGAAANTLFRPFPGEVQTSLQAAAMAENMILLMMIILAIIFRKKSLMHRDIIYLFLSYSLILCILIGLVTPISGAIVRYKVPLLPFLTISLLLCTDIEKIKQKISLIFKKYG